MPCGKGSEKVQGSGGVHFGWLWGHGEFKIYVGSELRSTVRSEKLSSMKSFKSIWEITPENAHPRARELLGHSAVWNYGDEDSPLGNDTGADTFAAYLRFRVVHPAGQVEEFIREQLASRGLPDADWDLLDTASLERALNKDNAFALLRRDDLIIGLAFAQLLLEGAVDPEVRRRAIMALRRQGTDVVLSFRGGGSEDAWKNQLRAYRQVLEVA